MTAAQASSSRPIWPNRLVSWLKLYSPAACRMWMVRSTASTVAYASTPRSLLGSSWKRVTQAALAASSTIAASATRSRPITTAGESQSVP